MILTRLLPDAGEKLDLETPGGRERLAELYRPGRDRWLRVNSVLSVTGSVVGADGTSGSLTNRVDRALLGVIRRLADVVLVGAATVRAEGHLFPRRSMLAVVTGTGDLTGHHFDDSIEPGRLLVVCPPDAVAAVTRSLGRVPHDTVPVEPVDERMPAGGIVTALRARGLGGIVCEGGPQLVAQLISAGQVDELCLTTSPTLTATEARLSLGRGIADRSLRLGRLLVDESSALYASWELPPDTE